ncbi:MAG: hypothetical protein P8181_00240 [bacterium]
MSSAAETPAGSPRPASRYPTIPPTPRAVSRRAHRFLALRVRENRVQIHLRDARKIGGETRRPEQQILNCLEVDAFAARTGENRIALDPFHHLARLGPAEWRDGHLHVLHHLDEDPAQAEHHEAAETRCGGGADDDLLAGRFLLHEHKAGFAARELPRDLVESRDELLAVGDIEHDAALVRFVDDVRGVHLEHAGETHRLRRLDKVLLAGHGGDFGDRDPVCAENLERIGL